MAGEEWFDVVNERDEVIGIARRAQVHAEGLRHRAAHVLVFDPAGRLFVQQRAYTKDNSPGCWDTSAAGHLDAGEDYHAAALRELGEELGVAPDAPLEPLFRFEACADTGQEFVWVYRAVVSAPLRLEPSEIIDGRWCSLTELAAWRQRAPDVFTATFHRIAEALGAATLPAGADDKDAGCATAAGRGHHRRGA